MEVVVTLRNGAQEGAGVVAAVMLLLRTLAVENPIALYELREICRDRNHQPFGNTGEKLEAVGLWKPDRGVHDTIMNIVLSAVQGTDGGADFDLVNPIMPAAPTGTSEAVVAAAEAAENAPAPEFLHYKGRPRIS